MRAIMVIGILAVPVTYIILTRLLSMVDTVRNGDPFVAENANRLQTIAWSVLVLEVMHAVVGIVAARVSTASQPLDIHWTFSVTRWLVVLLCSCWRACSIRARGCAKSSRRRSDMPIIVKPDDALYKVVQADDAPAGTSASGMV